MHRPQRGLPVRVSPPFGGLLKATAYGRGWLLAEYTKHLKAAGLIESEMTERILKSSISIMEAFNRVRNEQSLAHDNPVLNYDESLLIFNHVVGAVQFVESIERKLAARARRAKAAASSDDVPF
jgi:hypothetical protein